jgi:hypothetical protein
MIFWSLPYNFPYKVMDLLMMTSTNTQYVVVGSSTWLVELRNSTGGLNFIFDKSVDQVEPGNNFHTRVVYLEQQPTSFPPGLRDVSDEKVSAVSFVSNQVTYYYKEQDSWSAGDSVTIYSIAEEKDAAKYAALFAGDAESYRCNMEKVFERMEYVNDLYIAKAADLAEHFQMMSDRGEKREMAESCLVTLEQESVKGVLDAIKVGLSACSIGYEQCTTLRGHALKLAEMNDHLRDICVGLY